MVRFFVVLAPWLASCGTLTDPPEVARCEQHILSQIANPDTYEREEHASLALDGFWQVGIQYSHVDQTGRRITGAWQTCDYPIVDGRADTSTFLRLQGSFE